MRNKKLKKMVICAMGIAVVFCATMLIKIPNALDGYFNLGDGCILLFASVLDPLGGFLVGGVGSAMADLAGGYAHYVLPTLLIKGLEGLFVSWMFQRYGSKYKLITYLIASIWMVFGYFLAKWYLKASLEVALLGIPENILQSGVGMMIAYLLEPTIRKLNKM